MRTPPNLHHEDIIKTYPLCLCATLALFGASAASLQAQVITNGEYERGLRMPNTVPYDGEGYAARYAYGLGTGIAYIGGDPRRMWYNDYLDRADRAAKFGYPMPINPYFESPPPAGAAPAGRSYMGFGIFRRR